VLVVVAWEWAVLVAVSVDVFAFECRCRVVVSPGAAGIAERAWEWAGESESEREFGSAGGEPSHGSVVLDSIVALVRQRVGRTVVAASLVSVTADEATNRQALSAAASAAFHPLLSLQLPERPSLLLAAGVDRLRQWP